MPGADSSEHSRPKPTASGMPVTGMPCSEMWSSAGALRPPAPCPHCEGTTSCLATFRADRIVIFVRAEDERRYSEEDVCGETQRRFDVPVTLATL